jgi:type I restriction enzyme S subunit
MKWETKSLDELGIVARGKSKHRPRNDPSLYGGRYPFIQTAEVKSANMYITEYKQTYNDKGLLQSKIWDSGTLCITIAANIADTAILTFPACFPDSIIGFIPYEGIADTRYIKYCFDLMQQNFKQISQGATQDNLSLEKLATIKFPVPDLKLQQRIADILSAYDDLIENNQKQIRLQEEAAMLLYKEWFVNLRFPGHENTKIVDGVPEGWSLKKLIDIADITMGQSPKSEYYNDRQQGLPFHQGVTNYGYRFVIDETYSTSYTRIAEAGSILFSVRAPVGRINITKNKIVIGRGLAAINHREGLQSFLFYMLKNRFYKDDLIGNGAIYASITKSALHSQEFLIPSDNLANKFNSVAKSIDQQITNADQQIILLKQARDRLLPRLLSGEIEV